MKHLLNVSKLGTLVEDLMMGDTVRISRPAGPAVLNPDTGELETPAPHIVYEGPGALVDAAGIPGLNLPVAGQPWPDDPKTTYRLLTPITAPVAARDDEVTVVRAAFDPASVGRTWRCMRPSQVATLIAVRLTWLDENGPTT